MLQQRSYRNLPYLSSAQRASSARPIPLHASAICTLRGYTPALRNLAFRARFVDGLRARISNTPAIMHAIPARFEARCTWNQSASPPGFVFGQDWNIWHFAKRWHDAKLTDRRNLAKSAAIGTKTYQPSSIRIPGFAPFSRIQMFRSNELRLFDRFHFTHQTVFVMRKQRLLIDSFYAGKPISS